MEKIKYDINLIKFISLFGTLTRTKVKDCIEGDPLIFVVEHGQIAKAIGKKASNIKRVENVFKRKIKVIEFNDNVTVFLKNVLVPIKVDEIKEHDKKITINCPTGQIKGKIIGRDSKNLKNYKKIVSRYFDIDEMIVK